MISRKKKSNKRLIDARTELFNSLDEGSICPCCGQNAKCYRIHITAIHLKVLDYFSTAKDGWHHYKEFSDGTSGHHAKLKWWNLIELSNNAEIKKQEDKPSTGFWRITNIGKDFIAGKIRIPRFRYIFNNTLVQKKDRETMDIHECMKYAKKKFSFSELMST